MVLDDVLKREEREREIQTLGRPPFQHDFDRQTTHPKVMLCIVEEQPDLPVSVREKYLPQRDDIDMIQLSQQLQSIKDKHVIYNQHKNLTRKSNGRSI